MSSSIIYDPISEALGLDPLEISYEHIRMCQVHDPKISREEAITRNSDIVTCSVCGVTGNGPNMARWHFENCKRKVKQCQQCEHDIPMQGIKPYLYKQKKYCNRDCYMESKRGIPPIEMTQEVRKKLSDMAISQSEARSNRMKQIRKNKFWNNGRWSKKSL